MIWWSFFLWLDALWEQEIKATIFIFARVAPKFGLLSRNLLSNCIVRNFIVKFSLYLVLLDVTSYVYIYPLSAKRAHLISVSRYLPQGKCLVHFEQSSLIFAMAYHYWQGQTLREFFLELQLWNLESTSEIKTCFIEVFIPRIRFSRFY